GCPSLFVFDRAGRARSLLARFTLRSLFTLALAGNEYGPAFLRRASRRSCRANLAPRAPSISVPHSREATRSRARPRFAHRREAAGGAPPRLLHTPPSRGGSANWHACPRERPPPRRNAGPQQERGLRCARSRPRSRSRSPDYASGRAVRTR